jgi:hypothetical protein
VLPSITDHFDDFARGIVDTKHVTYYVTFITFGLFLTAKSVDMERWRGSEGSRVKGQERRVKSEG